MVAGCFAGWKMKALFLDIDGVLNTPGQWIRGACEWKADAESWAMMLSPPLVSHLNRVLTKTGAKVVISSSWRIAADVDVIAGALRIAGFTGDVIGATAKGHSDGRMGEIRQWLDANPECGAWAIVDDTTYDGFEETGRFVETSTGEGLTNEGANALIRLLTE